MTVLVNTNPTLVDLMSMPGMEQEGEVIDILRKINPMLEDAPALECNDGSGHKTTVRTGYPTPTWGKLYQGLTQSKAKRQAITDTTGFLESSAGVDCRLVDDIEGAERKASIRLDESEGHLEGMSQEMASGLFYHDSAVDPEKFMGFAPRFSQTTAQNGNQIISGGGAGADNTSIWMITWDRKASHLLYPRGTKAGIIREDMGKQRVLDANGKHYYEYEENFKWHMGLSVRDWRYVVRIPNIDVSDLSIDASTGADLIERMTQGYYQHEGRRTMKGKTQIYGNTNIVKYLDFQARNAVANLFLNFSEAGPNASEVLNFRGMQLRESDALLNSEQAVL